MKKLYAIFVVLLLLASPASACTTWAKYGSYDLGNWKTDQRTVYGGKVGNSFEITNQHGWRHWANAYISHCKLDARNAATRAKSHWPDSSRKIDAFYKRQASSCQSFIKRSYHKYANKFCE